MEGLVSFDMLKKWLRYESKSSVIKWLENKGIAFEVGKDGEPITTKEAINKRLLGGGIDGDEIEFEM